ncbi:MAG: hypothetical protein J6R59_00145 [Paludibacteraceae bacterium]|nr:hypothetical protein [Paludibacteraceae bacterium]
MRKRDEEVIKKVVDKIIDSKVLLTGDGDFCVWEYMGEISTITIRNLFSPESSISEIAIGIHGSAYRFNRETAVPAYVFELYKKPGVGETLGGRLLKLCFEVNHSNLEKSPSFNRLVEYIEENKHLILHNDKEYGKSHTLIDADFI